VGRASQYDIRYTTDTLTADNWETALPVSSPPTPGKPGSTETYAVSGLSFDTTYNFGIKTADEVPNWSALSTVLVASTGTRLCAATAPESLLCAIEALYQDRGRPTSQRLALYDSLLTRDFLFRFQPADIANGLPPNWAIESEIAAHSGLFSARDQGQIYSLTVSITHGVAQDLDPPQPGREGWKEVFASDVHLRLMFNQEDGLEVIGGQAEFLFPPAVGNRWYIAEWSDLPRPGQGPVAVEVSTWGQIKFGFFR
jgi:hypothetical protein